MATFKDIGGLGQIGEWIDSRGQGYSGPKKSFYDTPAPKPQLPTSNLATKPPVLPQKPVVPTNTPPSQQKPPVEQPGAINQPSGTGTSGQNTANPANFLDSFTFSKLLTSMSAPLQKNQDLVDARNKIFTYLYDRPLTEEEKSSLTPSLQRAMESNDRNLIDMEIRLINDEIQGRKDTLDQSLKYITEGYKYSIEEADKLRTESETKRQNAINNVLNFVDKYGDRASEQLKNLYGDSYITQLKDMGIDIESMQKIPTVAQQKLGTNTGFSINIPQGTLAYANNNPGNLRYVGQEGATLGKNGFAKFETPEAGYDALLKQIETDAGRGLTIREFISKYAPPTENDTETYIKQLVDSLGVPEDTLVSDIYPNDLADFIITKESGASREAIPSDIELNAQMLVNGTPPSVFAKRGAEYNKMIAAARRIDPSYDPSQAQIKYEAAKRFWTGQNSAQMNRFRGLAESVVNTIDEVKKLSEEVKNSGITPLNKAKLLAYVNLYGNTPMGQTISMYLGAVNTLKEEFANLANGGYAPTEAVWELANKQINENYGVDQIAASLTEIQRLINFRVNALTELQPLNPTDGSNQTYVEGQTATYNGDNYVFDGTNWIKQ